MTTYMRPFAGGNGYGKIDPEQVVPENHAALHKRLKDRRNKLAAHTDANAPEEIRRIVEEWFPKSGELVGRMLSPTDRIR